MGTQVKKICDTIAKTDLFKELDKSEFSKYCSRTSIRIAVKGEIIENEGDECDGIGVLLEGKLALQKYASTGDFVTVGLVEEGGMYGEDLLFGTLRYFQVTIESVTHSKILYIPKSVLNELLKNNYELNQNYIRLLSDKIIMQNERISLLSQKTLRQKIAFYILELYKKKPLKDQKKSRNILPGSKNDLRIELPVSKEVIAKLLAMPRPSFSRELINMEKDGYIKVNGRAIEILDLEKLESGALEGYDIY